MKRILIITAVFPPEPVTSATLNYDLAVELAKSYEVMVLKPKPSRPVDFDFSLCNEKSGNNTFKELILNSYVHPGSSFYGRMKESCSFGQACADYINQHKHEIDFVYNGTTHKIYTEPASREDYFIHCLKDKVRVISTFMTLDLRHSADYQATKEEIIEAYERRLV